MKALLVIADGLGWLDSDQGNAIRPETMPFLHRLARDHGVAQLEASGVPVGLGEGQAGNSEAGHLTIGAGRRVPSLLEGIGEANDDGSFASSPVWSRLQGAPALHVIGLLSDAGVHGYWPNLVRSATAARQTGVEHVYIHAILDGVDSQQGSAPRLLAELTEALEPHDGVELSTVMGRRWACDRTGDLAVTQVLVDHLSGEGESASFEPAVLEAFLQAGNAEKDLPCHTVSGRFVEKGEPVLLTNHRADRTAQVARLFRDDHPVYALVELDGEVPIERVFFPKRPLSTGVASELKRHGIGSVRVAEHCKFPHVTYFFNGFHESMGEDCVCIPSIPEAEIGERPEMSASQVTDAVLECLRDESRRAVIVNLANTDQVGHTGNLEAARTAAGVVDKELERLHSACQRHEWTLLITSDHGNADVMADTDGRPLGSHSKSPVPFVAVPAPGHPLRLTQATGSLANVGATFLSALGLSPPEWMEASLLDSKLEDTHA